LSTALVDLTNDRAGLRRWFLARMSGRGDRIAVTLRLRINGSNKVFHMREANEAKYLIGGELVRGVFEVHVGVCSITRFPLA
jgi:hypothetical protein